MEGKAAAGRAFEDARRRRRQRPEKHTPPQSVKEREVYNVIANPQAGEGKKKKLLERALARFAERGKQVRLYQTEKPGDAAAFAAKLCREGEGDIVAFGGDGTLHEVLKGFENF